MWAIILHVTFDDFLHYVLICLIKCNDPFTFTVVHTQVKATGVSLIIQINSQHSESRRHVIDISSA